MVGIFLPPLVNFNSERLPMSTMLSSNIRGSKRRIKDGFLSRWSHQSCWTVYSVITGSSGRAFLKKNVPSYSCKNRYSKCQPSSVNFLSESLDYFSAQTFEYVGQWSLRAVASRQWTTFPADIFRLPALCTNLQAGLHVLRRAAVSALTPSGAEWIS